jgi:hypothetical protein
MYTRLYSSIFQVQNKGPLPATLPASLLSDVPIASNGLSSMTAVPSAMNSKSC